MYVYICICVYVYIYVYIYIYVCVHVYMYMCVYIYINAPYSDPKSCRETHSRRARSRISSSRRGHVPEHEIKKRFSSDPSLKVRHLSKPGQN